MENERGMPGVGEVVDARSGVSERFASGLEMVGERGAEKTAGGSVKQGLPVVVPVVVGDDGTEAVADSQSVSVNLTTRDGEKVEKEWIEKVRGVMRDTRENPRRREEEIFRVKKDFIKKRFGREIGGGEKKL